MMNGGLTINPWSSQQSTDYGRIIEQFGLQSTSDLEIPSPSKLHRRGIVFAHRDFDVVLQSQKCGEDFGVLTGLMPSGKMHMGHSMVIDQVKWLQSLGGDVTIAVADLESSATRGISLSEGRRTAINEYISYYAALGLDPESTEIYFQSRRSEVQKLGFLLGKKTNIGEMESIYGFNGSTNMAHVQAPLVQAGDILHPQLDEFGGIRPIVVPVGVDQDPHLRLTRGLASKSNWFNIAPDKSRGLSINLSINEESAQCFGVDAHGRINREKQRKTYLKIEQTLSTLGFSDISSNPKQGTVSLPGAKKTDTHMVRKVLLKLERELGGLGLMAPASTYHRFAVGLTGDKMSSSKPKTTLFLGDDLDVTAKKIKKSFSGGQATLEEHRRLGGNPDIDVAYQYLMYFFEEDDKALHELYQGYKSGKILAGEMKQTCIDKASEWLKELKEKKDETAHLVEAFLSKDSKD